MNAHVAATPGGRLAWMSDPIDGTRHDSHRLTEAAVLTGRDAGNWMGDKDYTGNNMITPLKKPPYRDLPDGEKEVNTQANKIRWIIEQVIAHLKTWRTLDTDYRRPTGTRPSHPRCLPSRTRKRQSRRVSAPPNHDHVTLTQS